ncbi:MAG: hypothetical protein OEY87_05200 [Gammaproteobacteria bacterium]|nr:hypothetical protein [Gammaproteobacteria bacterium]MDH5735502.1 hypothetical protein [Gammaproteobacteria bacterium]
MNRFLKTGFIVILAMLTLSCSNLNPYSDPDSQRERAKQAQDEMRRDR